MQHSKTIQQLHHCHLEEAVFSDVDDRCFALSGVSLLFGDETHDLVQVENGTMELVAFQMVSAHAYFTEVTGMVLVEVDSVVMLTSGITATTRMFSRGKRND